jgi:hypothetical protein
MDRTPRAAGEHMTGPGGNSPALCIGSSARSGRVIFARDLEPILTRSTTGPRLHIEGETFGAILPATPHVLKLLAAKLNPTVTA